MPTIFNFIIIIIFSTSLTQAQWLTSEPGFRRDICYNDTQLDNYKSFCLDSVIADGRDELYPTSLKQCRILCRNKVSQHFDVSSRKTNCGFCRNDSAIADYTLFRDGIVNQEDLCIPRGVCIDQCGLEGDGCIFSGSCETIFCFKGKNVDTPAYVSRATHAGPGTVLTVQVSESGESPFNTTIGKVKDLDVTVVISAGSDLCIHHGIFDIASKDCLFSDPDPAITDGRIDWGHSDDIWNKRQCRSYCMYFNRDKFEVERLQTRCGYCSQETASLYFNKTKFGDSMVCIPHAKCIEQCGPPRSGCWYTGSCESQICVSSITSKRPVVFTNITDTGYGVDFRVNHSLPAIGIDPPMFPTSGRTDPGSPPRPRPTKPSSNPPTNPNSTTIITPCIATHHLRNYPLTHRVFPTARRAPVLCDTAGSCATAGHIVVWGGRAMRMGTYCHRLVVEGGGASPCVRRVMWVNSPRYGRGVREASGTMGLEFTAFAARYGTRVVEKMFDVLVRVGL